MISNKDELKNNLTIEDVFNLVEELGGEPIMNNDFFIAKTICHGGDSHKLYYYDNSHLFHCYTGCGDTSFDIFELILKIYKDFSLPKAISFIAKYFNYDINFNSEEDENFTQLTPDWEIIKKFKNRVQKDSKIIELKTYNKKILEYMPLPHIEPWENESIKYEIIKTRGIKYNPKTEGIIIPHYNINGELIGIRERTLIKENEIYGKYRPACIQGKMYNHPLGYNLYNLNYSKNFIKKIKKVIIFEGKRQSRPSPLFHVAAWGYIFNIANGQLNRKIKVVRKSKS